MMPLSQNETNLNWDELFMFSAKLTSQRSKDPRTKVGACIVSREKRIVGLGYNGMPQGLDDAFPWGSVTDGSPKKPYVVHAEANAILNSSENRYSIYTTKFPCQECAKLIAQTSIKSVVHPGDPVKGPALEIFNA